MSLPPRNGRFPDTRWSLVISAKVGDTGGLSALEELCEAYWYPLYAYARRLGNGPDQAEDLTQSYFLHILKGDLVARLDEEAGRLRSYFLASFRNFIYGEWRRATTKRRGGQVTFVSFDQEQAEEWLAAFRPGGNPDQEFDRSWAHALLQRVFRRLRASYARRGEEKRFDVISPFLEAGSSDGGYRKAAEELGMSEGSVRVAVFRLRNRYRKSLREEVAETVVDPSEIDGEIEALLAILAGS